MSRTELSTRKSAAAATRTALPSNSAELEHFRLAAAEGLRAELIGTFLQFRRGAWQFGKDKKELAAGTQLVALMHDVQHGYVRWTDKKVTGQVMGRIGDGFKMPARETLGDNDPAAWSIGLDGKRSDPWLHTLHLPLKSSDGSQHFTFVAGTDSGRQAVYRLIESYANLGRNHPGELPVVQLGTEAFESRKLSTTIFVPAFRIVGWTNRSDMALLGKDTESPAPSEEPIPQGEMNDEVPY
jgi:hypothetical protein